MRLRPPFVALLLADIGFGALAGALGACGRDAGPPVGSGADDRNGAEDAAASVLEPPGLAARPRRRITERSWNALQKSDAELRARVLHELVESGSSDDRLVPVLDRILADPASDEVLRARAQMLRMQVMGDRPAADEVAMVAARRPEVEWTFRRFMGQDADVVLLAARRAGRRPEDESGRADVRLAAASPEAMRRRIDADLSSEDPVAAVRGLDLARGLHPPPGGIARAVVTVFGSPDVAVLGECVHLLAESDYEWNGEAAKAADALAARLPDLPGGVPWPAGRALVRIGHVDATVQRALLEAVRTSSYRAFALDALADLGPCDASASTALLALADSITPGDRVSGALASIGFDDAVPCLKRRLRDGGIPVRRAILDRLRPGSVATALWPLVVEATDAKEPGVVARALGACARLDPRLEREETARILRHALLGSDAARGTGALDAVGHLKVALPEILRLVVASLAAPDETVARAAAERVRQIASVDAFRESLRPVVLAALAEPTTLLPLAAAARHEVAGLLAPQDTLVRRRLLAGLAPERSWIEREGVLRAYLHVEDPSVEEVYAVARTIGTNIIADEAIRVLLQPPWLAVKDREHILTVGWVSEPYR